MNRLVGTTISSSSSDYVVEAEMCCCRFGVVLQCRKKLTNKTVVLKLFEDTLDHKFANQEVVILETLKFAGSKDFNIVTLNDAFMFDGQYYLEFEKLDICLDDHVKEKPLKLKEVRPILYQLVQTLIFLGSRKIIHEDVKTSHVMMVDHLRQPFKIKLINFGSASTNSTSCSSHKVMSGIGKDFYYKAPEMLEGMPYDQSVDMWALGCVAAEMMTGSAFFAGVFVYDLLSPQAPVEDGEKDVEALRCDRMAFIDLLSKMLLIEPAQRITPGEALEHPFLTLSHLDRIQHHAYVKLSTALMEVCHTKNVEEEGFPGCSPSIPTNKSRIDLADNRPGTKKRRSNNLTKLSLFLIFALLVLFASVKLDVLIPFFTGIGSHLLFTGRNISQLDVNTTLIQLEFLHDPWKDSLSLFPSKKKRKLVKLGSLPTGVQPTPVNRFLEMVLSVIVKMEEMRLKTTDYCVTMLTETRLNKVTTKVTLYTSYVVVTVIAVLLFQINSSSFDN